MGPFNEEVNMKRSLLLVVVFLVLSLLSGCIISKTPAADTVYMAYGEQKTFSVTVFGNGNHDTIIWTLDGVPIANTGQSYDYTALAGGHELAVRATYVPLSITDTASWYIIANSPPTANAGPHQTVAEGITVTLDASNSSDPDGDIASYAWEQTDGPYVTLSDPGSVKPTFTSPDVGIGGEALTFKVTVTDSTGLTSTATTIVNVTWSNEPPTANAGPDQTAGEGVVVILDGSGSTDPDGGIAQYEWKQIYGPIVVLTNANTMQASFTTPDVGPSGAALIFELTVTDNGGLKSTAMCIVDVTWMNDPPTANAGPDQTVAEVTVVTLDASGSTDPDNGIASYSWEQTDGPVVTLSDPGAVKPTFTAPNVDDDGAVLKFKLTVTDNGGLKSTDTCIVNVTGANDPPTAEAGPDQNVTIGTLVTLNGEGSSDPENEIASYQWQQVGGPSVTLTNPDAAIAQFTATFAVGTVLTFELTVTDAGGLQATDTCVITITSYATGYTGPAGGWVFYDKGFYSDGWRYLEAAPSDQSTGIQWYNGSYIVTGATETGAYDGAGMRNTVKIVNAQGAGSYAAQLCYDLSITNNGVVYDDWFLPSKDELNLMYLNLKVPGIGGFANDRYWTSSENNDLTSYTEDFTGGSQNDSNKKLSNRVRAARAF